MILLALWLCAALGLFVATSTYRMAAEYATCGRYAQMLELYPTMATMIEYTAKRYVYDVSVQRRVRDNGSMRIALQHQALSTCLYQKHTTDFICVTIFDAGGKQLIKYYLGRTLAGVVLTFHSPAHS